jgi:hypothetical protein
MRVWSQFETFNKTALQCGTALAGDKPHYKNPINVDGGPEASTRFVPQVSWFDERLLGIDNEQLLSLLPSKEREAMMLFLGRAMLGREGTPHTNGNIQNLKFRSVMVMVGNQAGMGRTTLLEYLSEAMKLCGYRAQPLENLTGRFGHGKTATNDVGFIDDMTPIETIHALSSSLLKTVSSGGTLMVENKGQPAYSVTSQGVYMLCTNQLDLPKLTQLDSGNLSRLMPLRNACSNDDWAKEYRSKYGYELNTDQTYEALAEEYQVPIQTLVCLLLARSAEMFGKFMDLGQRAFISKLMELKGQFQINTDMDYMDLLFQNFAYVASLDVKRPNVPGRFDIDIYLKRLIKLGGIDIPGCSDSKDLILDYARAAYGVRKKGVAAMAKEFMSVLTSEHGLGYISDYATLMQMYKQRIPQMSVQPITNMQVSVIMGNVLSPEEKYWSDLEDQIKANG